MVFYTIPFQTIQYFSFDFISFFLFIKFYFYYKFFFLFIYASWSTWAIEWQKLVKFIIDIHLKFIELITTKRSFTITTAITTIYSNSITIMIITTNSNNDNNNIINNNRKNTLKSHQMNIKFVKKKMRRKTLRKKKGRYNRSSCVLFF